MTAQQFKTAILNSPWAYIRDGLLSEGHLRLRFGGGGGGGGGETYFGKGLFLRGLLSEIYDIWIGYLILKSASVGLYS